MASVKVKFRPSSVSGKEGSIYYRVIHNRAVRQIKTDCRIFENEWNGKASAVAVPVLASNERKNYLQSVANRIEWDIKRLTAIIALLEKGTKVTRWMTSSQNSTGKRTGNPCFLSCKASSAS